MRDTCEESNWLIDTGHWCVVLINNVLNPDYLHSPIDDDQQQTTVEETV